MNEPVSFELAKLLKDKGFNDYTPLKFFSSKPSGYNIPDWNNRTAYKCEDIYNKLSLGYFKQDYFTWAPTITDVVMWFYKHHSVWINVYRYKDHAADNNDPFTFKSNFTGLREFNSPEETYEEAIKHLLNTLI